MKSNIRVLLVRLGQMNLYAGPREADEAPAHGGKFNDEGHLGHEAFNFFDFEGRLYGTFGIIAESIRLRNIDPGLPRDADDVERVLVIFFARYSGGQQIVGWYEDAKVLRRSARYPRRVASHIQRQLDEEVKRRRQLGTDSGAISKARFKNYRLEAETRKAVLLPIQVRKQAPPIPRGSGATGQCNVSYLYRSGSPSREPWIRDVLRFVGNYRGPNLLLDESEHESEAFNAQERAAGFQPDSEIRDSVEQYAMARAKRELHDLGFRTFIPTHKTECYDYTCEKGGRVYYVEVKGTQGRGTSVTLTKNEVEHWRDHKQHSIAVIVHHVEVDSETGRAHGGTAQVCFPWHIRSGSLEATQYTWTTLGCK